MKLISMQANGDRTALIAITTMIVPTYRVENKVIKQGKLILLNVWESVETRERAFEIAKHWLKNAKPDKTPVFCLGCGGKKPLVDGGEYCAGCKKITGE